MIRSIFILTTAGDILIEKHWRGFLNRSIIDQFINEVDKYVLPDDVPPVISTGKFYLIHFRCNDLFFVCPVQGDVPPLLVTDFLFRFSDICKNYFGSISEEVVKNNFVTIYQLLDEVMDSGVPFNTEPNILRGMVPAPSLIPLWNKDKKLELPLELGTSIPWRHSVKHTTNEIFFDIIEEIDAVIDSNGMVISSSIYGTVESQCNLSGMPDLTLRWTNPRMIDDASFHPCVRYNRYEMDRVISFVPPDGAFTLMNYRIYQIIQPPMYCKPSISFGETGGRVSIMIGPKNCGDKTVEDVIVTLPIPSCVTTHNLEASIGMTKYDDKTRLFKWILPKLPKDKIPMLEGTLTLPSGAPPPDCNPTVRLQFNVNMFAASVLKIDSIALHNESYKPFKGVKSFTKAGKFQIRTGF